jgi:hypothetical protein
MTGDESPRSAQAQCTMCWWKSAVTTIEDADRQGLNHRYNGTSACQLVKAHSAAKHPSCQRWKVVAEEVGL